MALDPLAAQSAASRPPANVLGAGGSAVAAKADASGEDQDMSFWDVLDIVNPLQHIPVVSSIYRAVTGDQIKPAMQIGGGILFGGVIGGVAAIANAALQEVSGKDLGEHMLAGLGFGDDAAQAGQAAPQVAAAPPLRAPASPPQAPAQQQSGRQAESQARSASSPQQLQQQALAAANMGVSSMGAPGMGAPGALSAGLSAGAGGQPQGLDPNLVMNSGHTPAKMPKRDAMLASAMPRGSHASAQERAPATDRAGPTLPPPRAAGAPSAAAPSAASASPALQTQPAQTQSAEQGRQAATAANPIAANHGAPAGRDAMAEIMMRNLAKYQAEKRAQNHTMRTSG